MNEPDFGRGEPLNFYESEMFSELEVQHNLDDDIAVFMNDFYTLQGASVGPEFFNFLNYVENRYGLSAEKATAKIMAKLNADLEEPRGQ